MRPSALRPLVAAFALPVVFFAAAAHGADVKQPTGYGKAKFGSTVEEVKKVFPKLEALTKEQMLGAPIVNTPDISRYALHEQSFPGASKPIDVELRFWKGKLWLYIAYFPPEEADAVLAKLTSEYGPQANKSADYPTWKLENTTVLVEKKLGRVTVNDNSFTKEAQEWFLGELKKGMSARRPPAAGAPPAAPAAPAPPPAH
jgi:hypothetical protein